MDFYNPKYTLTGMLIMLTFYILVGLWYWLDLSIYFKRKYKHYKERVGPIICNYCNSDRTMTYQKHIRIDFPSTYACCHECCRSWRL